MEQYYNIAGLTVKMDSFGRNAEQAKKYLCEPAQPDICIDSAREHWKERFPTLTDDECEYMGACASFYQNLLEHNGMMIHSSAVVVDGRAYLFSAESGTGKSTHTQLYLKRFGDRAFILNDDKPAVRLEDGVWYAYGTPWSGKTNLNVNVRAPLAGIAVLERGQSNEIEPFTGPEVIRNLLEQTLRPREAVHRLQILKLADQLIRQVPVWKLRCNMEPEAAMVSYRAMSGETK